MPEHIKEIGDTITEKFKERTEYMLMLAAPKPKSKVAEEVADKKDDAAAEEYGEKKDDEA
jgi:hypothetical protein